MSELLPDARLEIIDGAGHNIHMEAPQKFVTIVLDFLLGG
jgi:2-succinyl-6-hydroxy-2,4-cyclohexadiene-1-carboxylate synthase